MAEGHAEDEWLGDPDPDAHAEAELDGQPVDDADAKVSDGAALAEPCVVTVALPEGVGRSDGSRVFLPENDIVCVPLETADALAE